MKVSSEDNRKAEELLVDEWRKTDPYLLETEGFIKFISDMTYIQQGKSEAA